MLLPNLIPAHSVCPSRLKDWWLVISCSDLQKTSQRFYKTDWQHRRLEILAWSCIVNISQMQGKCLFQGRQQLRVEIKTKQKKQQQKLRRDKGANSGREKEITLFTVWRGDTAQGSSDKCTPIHTCAHMCWGPRGKYLRVVVKAHSWEVTSLGSLTRWHQRLVFFLLLSAFLSPAISAHTHSTFIKNVNSTCNRIWQHGNPRGVTSKLKDASDAQNDDFYLFHLMMKQIEAGTLWVTSEQRQTHHKFLSVIYPLLLQKRTTQTNVAQQRCQTDKPLKPRLPAQTQPLKQSF